MILKNSQNENIDIEDKPFAKGGEGAIFFIRNTNYNEFCVKIFHPGKIDSRIQKLEYMVQHPLSAPKSSLYKICWPSDFVFQDGNIVGFIMPLSFPHSKSLYDIYLSDDNTIFDRRRKKGVENRLKLLYNIATAIKALHLEGYVLVDFKPQNVLFTDIGQISVIDLDSLQIAPNKQILFQATAFTIDYAYPNEFSSIKNKAYISPKWDCYSFAVVAYQILLGIHPFTASTNLKDKYGNTISGLFDLMAGDLFPFGSHQDLIAVIPPPQYYFFSLPPVIQNLFKKIFDLRLNDYCMNDWLFAIMDVLKSQEIIEPNLFRNTPHTPIVIIIKQEEKKDFIYLKWKGFFCDNVKINKYDVTDAEEIQIPISEREITIYAYNSHGNQVQKVSIKHVSKYCINCGNQFYSNFDNFCTCCGMKRLL